MSALLVLALQSFLADTLREEELPKIGDLERAVRLEKQEIYPWLGIEPMAVWTAFDGGLHLENSWGYGADATVTLDYGTSAFLGFRLGALGWNTRNDSQRGGGWAQVREYRIGVFGEFPVRFLEIGVGANVGGYRYRGEGRPGDTAGYFEFQAMIGVRPSPFVWLGVVGMQTFTSSRFNSNQDHFYINYSIGPAIEARF